MYYILQLGKPTRRDDAELALRADRRATGSSFTTDMGRLPLKCQTRHRLYTSPCARRLKACALGANDRLVFIGWPNGSAGSTTGTKAETPPHKSSTSGRLPHHPRAVRRFRRPIAGGRTGDRVQAVVLGPEQRGGQQPAAGRQSGGPSSRSATQGKSSSRLAAPDTGRGAYSREPLFEKNAQLL